MDSSDLKVVPAEGEERGGSRAGASSQYPRRTRKDEDFDRALLQQPRQDFASLSEVEAYLRANPSLLCHPDDVEHLVLQEFPHSTSVPTAEDLDQSMLGEGKGVPFGVGDYAERLGDDMRWHLEPIRRLVVFKDEPDEVYYKFESGVVENSAKVRCSEEAVCRHFGMRPHLWQQYALLRFESKLRFQQDHENDFEEVDYLRFAQRSWDKWLAHPKNAEFLALYESKPEHVRDKLKTFMFSPFALCRQMLKDKARWNFDQAECSAYQYASFLGSGFITCVVCMFMQFVVPFMILLYTIRVSTNFPNFTMLPNSSSLDMERILNTSWDGFCYSSRAFDAVMMNYVIFAVYLIRVSNHPTHAALTPPRWCPRWPRRCTTRWATRPRCAPDSTACDCCRGSRATTRFPKSWGSRWTAT